MHMPLGPSAAAATVFGLFALIEYPKPHLRPSISHSIFAGASEREP